ncbi:hypothetical protein C0Q70_10709 [Pomacea canaliculata]|uniref:Uncharacterized protein n=1 Tax=Pomacea canaliculata TaxID=400727 RepID=A0A2T7P3X5_POMCA|nr:hypothetical protein C0Q70_10709 [Pomacea canaliculata]
MSREQTTTCSKGGLDVSGLAPCPSLSPPHPNNLHLPPRLVARPWRNWESFCSGLPLRISGLLSQGSSTLQRCCRSSNDTPALARAHRNPKDS